MANELVIFQERIRKVWHEEQWWFSVVDVIEVLTDSPDPSAYWRKLKQQLKDDEGAIGLLKEMYLSKLLAPDGKLRETDCASFAALISLIHFLPAQNRRKHRRKLDTNSPSSNSGIYAIINTVTQEQYIGSSSNIAKRFLRHKALLRRGKHHASRLQQAWNTYGEETFHVTLLEEVATTDDLAEIEQRYLEARQPAYNGARVAQNLLSLPLIAPERLQQLLRFLFDTCASTITNPLFHTLRDAIIYGFVKPGPNFPLLVQAAVSDIATWEELNAYRQQWAS